MKSRTKGGGRGIVCGLFGRTDWELSYIVGGIISLLRNRGCDVLVEREFAEKFETGFEADKELIVEKAETVFVLGGDGTMLKVASLFLGKGTTIVGINIGRVGFLTTGTEAREIVEDVLDGNFRVERKRALLVKLKGREFLAINDAVLLRHAEDKMPSFNVKIMGENAGSFRADGMVLSTPLGSTAYSLATGGPIIMPNVKGYIIGFIAPFSIFVRHIIVSDEDETQITVETETEVPLFLDGTAKAVLKGGDTVSVGLSGGVVNIAMTRGREFFSILKEKLGWEGRVERG